MITFSQQQTEQNYKLATVNIFLPSFIDPKDIPLLNHQKFTLSQQIVQEFILMHCLNIRSLVVKSNIFQKINHFMASKDRRIEEVGFKTQDIINTNELTYIPNQKMTFTNGKFLVYKSKKGLFVSFRRFLPYYSSISGIAALIYFNPFKAVFPAAIPILWVIELILIKMMFKRYQWNQYIVHEIYLLNSGSTTEVHFADSTRRKWVGQPQILTYYNTIFADPIQKEKQDIMPNANPFPENLQDFNKQTLSWGWCKYYSNGQNFLLIPKNAELIKKDIMVNIMKGKTVKNI